MRTRAAFVAILSLGVLLGGTGLPARAEEPRKIESTLIAPGAGVGHKIADETACPGTGAADGSNYRWIDLEGGYTHFKVMGPQYLWDPSTTPAQWGDYDMDMYVYDDKCKLIGEGATPNGAEKTSTKRPARFVLIDYFFGVQPNLKFTLVVANSPIK